MTKILTNVKQPFDSSGNATLTIPNGAEIKAFKFYEGDADDLGQQVGVVFLVDSPQTTPGTHTRMFMLLPDAHHVPPEFKEYKAGPVPYGPNKVIVHCIEVTPALVEHGDFNADRAAITDLDQVDFP